MQTDEGERGTDHAATAYRENCRNSVTLRAWSATERSRTDDCSALRLTGIRTVSLHSGSKRGRLTTSIPRKPSRCYPCEAVEAHAARHGVCSESLPRANVRGVQ